MRSRLPISLDFFAEFGQPVSGRVSLDQATAKTFFESFEPTMNSRLAHSQCLGRCQRAAVTRYG
jgi:hypothetical protein